MKLKPEQLATHLQRPLAPIYVLSGDEPLLVQEAADAIRAAARAQEYSERTVMFVETAFDWNALTQAAASLSLLSLSPSRHSAALKRIERSISTPEARKPARFLVYGSWQLVSFHH